MDQKPNLDLVILAVNTLYKNPDKKEKERASQWLLNLQNSIYAWTISDELLHNKLDLETCYFAAQTMRTKIHHVFHELPLEAHNSLRDSLLEHISQITEGTDKIIITQLCLALADLILQMPMWHRASLDLISKFSNHSYVLPLLEILAVLPEELENKTVRLGENRRQEILNDLTECAPTVVEFLIHCCNTYGNNYNANYCIIATILRCFTSWVSVEAVSCQRICNNVIVNLAFQILNYRPHEGKQSVPALCEAATECISVLFQYLISNNVNIGLESYLFNNIVQLETPYHYSVANEDQSRSIDYCKLFTELAESLLPKIVATYTTDTPDTSIKVFDLVLMCVGHHDFEVAEMTFNLWYLLSDVLHDLNNSKVINAFEPYIERLITSLCKHCQMEPDSEGLLDDGDDFKDFRSKVTEVIRDVVFIVGSTSCFQQMFLHLRNPEITWDQMEATIYIMAAVAKYISKSENMVVPQVIEAIIHIPETTHIAVRHTSISLLGELSEWIQSHPQVLDPVLNFLFQAIPQPGLGAVSAFALECMCTSCKQHLAKHVPMLLQLLQQIDTFGINNDAIIGFYRGICSIIIDMPHSDLTAALREMCTMQINPLCQLVEQDIHPTKGTKSDPILWLDRLSCIFRSTIIHHLAQDEIHPCKMVIIEIWPIMSKVFNKYQSDTRIMERCCRSIRYMLRCASCQLQEILDSLVSQIVGIYRVYPHSCFLYVGSILVDEYPQFIGGLIDMLQMFLEPTFQLLQAENGLRNHPDTVDDFFRLCGRFMRRAPIEFLQCTSLVPIMQCALLASTLDHKEANTSVMKFFCDLINQGHTGPTTPNYNERRKLVTQILDQFGQPLVISLLHACVISLQAYLLPEIADVFIELLDFNKENTKKWIENAINILPKKESGGVLTATPEQLQNVQTKITRSNTSKAISGALWDLLRYYR